MLSNYAQITLHYSKNDGLLDSLKFTPASVPDSQAQNLYDSISSIKNMRQNQVEGELDKLEQRGKIKVISKTKLEVVYQVL